jgi:aminobenzoyl-glutamate utilization protein B
MNLEKNALRYLEEKSELLEKMAKDIWEHPQLGGQETYAVKLITDQLIKEGFTIKEKIGGIPTAFVASWGEGKPIIGILGEYDALPGLSQQVLFQKKPVQEGDPGHGCGHNLLGVGSLGATLAIKEAMEKEGIGSTVRYYGCPAEETLIGKVFMAREGVFNDLDVALTWHPMNLNMVWDSSCLAMNSFKVNFYGRSAHAAAMPYMGRSALDGIMLTDVGINYLREHIIPEARVHGVITNGGLAPNVVPDYAQAWYFVRAPHRDQVEEIYQRTLKIAEGAALMSDIKYNVEFIAGCYEYLPNETIGEIMEKKMKELEAPQFSAKERKFAQDLESTLPKEMVEGALMAYGLRREEVGDSLCNRIISSNKGPYGKGKVMPGSTDVGDVSFLVPTAQFMTAGMPVGVAAHSWQSTASYGSSIGFKAMLFATKILALTAVELINKPEILEKAKKEHKQAIRGKEYKSPLPNDLKSNL